jgi:outer membrane cobalamin receptor
MELSMGWLGICFGAEGQEVFCDAFRRRQGARKGLHGCVAGRIVIAGLLLMALIASQPVLSYADPTPKHLTLDEIVVTGDAATASMGTQVGIKKIEQGKNINIPDVLKNEPDIDVKRRTSIGDTADSLAIRGLSTASCSTSNNAPWVTSRDDLSYKSSSEGVCRGYYFQDTWQLSDRWMLTGGLRYDQYENKSIHGSTSPELDDDALTPKLTGTYRPTLKDTITASVYQALRTPGLPETYWWAEGQTLGDPVLKPETNNAIELLYQHDFSGSDFMRLSAYYYKVDDYIMSRFDPSWRGVYNIDRAELYGASLDGKAVLTNWLCGNLSLTWQQSKKEGDIYDTAGLSDEIDYLPDWKAGAGLEFKLAYQSVFNL